MKCASRKAEVQKVGPQPPFPGSETVVRQSNRAVVNFILTCTYAHKKRYQHNRIQIKAYNQVTPEPCELNGQHPTDRNKLIQHLTFPWSPLQVEH
jgi:hypothetical protein